MLLEIIGAVIGLAYLYFEYKADKWLWVMGLIMPAIYIYIFYEAGVYAYSGINIYYLIANFYGFYYWLKKDSNKKPIPITHTPKKYLVPLSVVFIILFVAIVWLLKNFTDSDVPYGDGFTTAMSVVALWMLSRKYVEHWLVWIVVNIICAIIYFYKGLYPTAILYTIYAVGAILGYFKWIKMMRKNEEIYIP